MPQSTSSRKSLPVHKPLNLALQGGGAHGAFTWGVLDEILEDGRIDIDGISGTSAGSMNAVVCAYGKAIDGVAGARHALEKFWKAISDAGQRYATARQLFWEPFFFGKGDAPLFETFKFVTNAFSPYQLNPGNFNPLIDILKEHVDFDVLRKTDGIKLFLSATNVRTGKVRVFNNEEITAEAVMASACLPQLFQAVEIDGDPYWDGGYIGNPSLFPFFYYTTTRDILIVHINPIVRAGTPTTPAEIYNRVNEITFNSSLIGELRSIAFVQKMLQEGWLKEKYQDRLKYILIHSLRADEVLADLSVASKFTSDWGFFTMMRDRGRQAAAEWITRHFKDIGERSTVDLRSEFLSSEGEQKRSPQFLSPARIKRRSS